MRGTVQRIFAKERESQLTTDNHTDNFYITPADERAVVSILDLDSLTWSQIPVEDPPIPAQAAVWDAHQVVTEIYRTEYRSLVRLAMLLVHDVPTAEEVVQDSFLAMHSAWRRLNDSQKALSYLRQAVVNRSRSVLRHRTVVDKNAPKPTPDEPSAESGAIALIERGKVVAALRQLPALQREALVLRYYGDFPEAEIATAMGISLEQVKSHMARGMSALKSMLERTDELVTVALPVSIYIVDEVIHAQVEEAVDEWLASAGVAIEERQPPIIGSWFQRMQARAKVIANSEAAQDLALTAVHAADARVILAQDATITATLLANLAPVIASLQPTKDAAIRAGALLIVKVDWVVQVVQLTAAQQALLDHQPQLSSDPHQIVAALQLSPEKHVTSVVDLTQRSIDSGH